MSPLIPGIPMLLLEVLDERASARDGACLFLVSGFGTNQGVPQRSHPTLSCGAVQHFGNDADNNQRIPDSGSQESD
jgi:hypothetical protein